MTQGHPQCIHVRRLSDQSIVHSIPCPSNISSRDLERTISGIIINMDERFYVDSTMVETVDGSAIKAG